MIAMVVDGNYRCLSMSDLPPKKNNGRVPLDYSGCDTFDHISEGHESWKAAIDCCLSTEKNTDCEFCNTFENAVSRWRGYMQYVEPNRVLVTLRNIPFSIHNLSSREKDVLSEVAEGKTNSQVAESLSIALSTVEKHRSHIRQTLDLSSEQELQLTAWIVVNPDIFNDLS